MTLDLDYGSKTSYTYIYVLFSCYYVHSYYVTGVFKKLKLLLLAVLILLKIKFGHTRKSLAQISIPIQDSPYQPLIKAPVLITTTNILK